VLACGVRCPRILAQNRNVRGSLGDSFADRTADGTEPHLRAAVASLQFLVDGYTLAVLADCWAAASSPAEQESIVRMSDLLHTLIREPVFASEPVFLFGLPFALIGLGVALDRAYPAWFGWSGFAVGAATLITGITWFAVVDLVPELTLWAALQPLEWLWHLVLGVVMWRESNTAREAAIE